jgi:hypothetical protein
MKERQRELLSFILPPDCAYEAGEMKGSLLRRKSGMKIAIA